MNTTSAAVLQKFVSSYNLKNAEGLILFDATVAFYSNDILHTIGSQVQVVTLPGSMVIYIFEFIKEEYKMTEMYSSAYYNFTNDVPGNLKITDANTDHPFVATITLL